MRLNKLTLLATLLLTLACSCEKAQQLLSDAESLQSAVAVSLQSAVSAVSNLCEITDIPLPAPSEVCTVAQAQLALWQSRFCETVSITQQAQLLMSRACDSPYLSEPPPGSCQQAAPVIAESIQLSTPAQLEATIAELRAEWRLDQ